MALEIFRLVGSIFVNSDDAEKSISKTDSKAQGLGKSLLNGVKTAGKWAAGITTAATTVGAAVVGASAKAVDAYADYEQAVGGIETLFKSSAGKVIENAEKAYMTAGVSATEYMESVTSFSASLLQALSGDTEAAAEIANTAMIDMSDNANKMGTDMSAIQNAYQGFAKQNYTMLDNLKLGYGGTKDEMSRLLADAQKISGIEYNIDNLSDVYSAIHVIQGELGITGTTAKEATTTISGSINMIKKRLSDFVTSLGSKIAPTVQQFLSLAIDNLPMVENLLTQITPVITDLFEMLLPPAMSLAESVLPLLMSLITSLIPPATQILEAILPVIIQLLDKLLPPVIQVVEALLPPLIAMLQPLLDLLSPLIDLLDPILQLAVSIISPLTDLITRVLSPLTSLVSKLIEVALVPLKAQFAGIAAMLSGTFTSALDFVVGKFEAIKGVFLGIIDFVKNVFKGNWKAAWDDIKSVFSNVWNGITETFKLPINWIIDGINSFIAGINSIQIPDWVPVVGGKGFHIAEIPKLATGGVLEKGQTGFLEGTGAEAVVPLENNRKWISAVADDMDSAGIGGSDKVIKLLSGILSALEDLSGQGVYLDTGKLVGALAGPMDKKLGLISAQKARA